MKKEVSLLVDSLNVLLVDRGIIVFSWMLELHVSLIGSLVFCLFCFFVFVSVESAFVQDYSN